MTSISYNTHKVLVTGGAGFIGSHLVDRLMNDGKKVTVFDNLMAGSEQNIRRWFGQRNFKFLNGDLLRMRDIIKAIKDCDTVFHLAANPEVKVGFSNSRIDYEQNVLCTYNLLEAIKSSTNCKKIIFTSTSTIYGEPSIIPTPEIYGPLMPISLYGASKLACESLISGYSNLFGFHAVIIRLANVIGLRSNHGVIYDFMQKLEKNHNQLEILGDGTQNKSYLHIEDCVSALTLLAEKAEAGVQIYNCGSTDRTCVTEIAKTIIDEMGLDNVNIKLTGGVDGGRGWKGDVKEMLLDVSNLRSLGWKPTYSSADAIRSTVRSMLHAQIKVVTGPF